MRRALRSLLLAFLLVTAGLLTRPSAVRAQLLADTLFTWQGYNRASMCRVRLYAVPPQHDRERVVLLQELAESRGPSTVSDARLLAELIGRQFGLDPARAYWVFHWGAFSFEGAAPDRSKELFLRAAFRRTTSNSLASPSWRVLSREEVEALTDRHFH